MPVDRRQCRFRLKGQWWAETGPEANGSSDCTSQLEHFPSGPRLRCRPAGRVLGLAADSELTT
jgi:hypothetical protein